MKKLALIWLMILILLTSGCSFSKEKKVNLTEVLKINKNPRTLSFHRDKLKSLPAYDPDSVMPFAVDLRGYDLSSLNVMNRYDDLKYADFDSKTIWPSSLPNGFIPGNIMATGKDPGLNVSKLHEMGITGKGIGIAIIDQALLVDHIEYKDNLKMYEEIHWSGEEAQMHGPAVASIAVGKTIGVAPGADLYYIAENHGENVNGEFVWDFTWLAKSIDRVLEINEALPKEKKIRVISISVGWSKDKKGYKEVTASVNKAKEQGVFVVSSSLYNTHGFMFNGLGRNPLSDPNLPSSYEPGKFWAKEFYNSEDFYSQVLNDKSFDINKVLLVPMDSRTTASPTGTSDYVFYRDGGWSWSIPYIAGLYALACQAKPDMTPDIFWDKATETGDTIKVTNNNKEFELKKIVNPVRLIESLKK